MKNLAHWMNCRLALMSFVALRNASQGFQPCPNPRLLAVETGTIHGKERFRTAKNQNGSVLVLALLMLVFLTLIGLAASTNTEVEIQIAGNEKSYNIAFNVADSGAYMTPKIIRRTVEEGAQPSLPGVVTYYDTGDTFFREVMGYITVVEPNKDIEFAVGAVSGTSGYTVRADVARARQISLGGGGVEFGSGSEGVGVGSASGVAVIYAMDCEGAGPSSAQSNILAEYRLIPGVAGGL